MSKLLSTKIENLRLKEETSSISKTCSGKYIIESESNDKGLDKEEIAESDRFVVIGWEEAWREIENLKKTVWEFHQENENLSITVPSQGEDIYVLTSKLEELAKFVRILNRA